MRKYRVLVVVGIGLLPAIAFAGETYSNASSDVFVENTARWAEGTLSASHNSPDDEQLIGCYTRATATTDTGGCYARQVGGSFVSCTTTNTRLLTAMRSLHSEIRMRFSWNASFQCTEIELRTASTEEPLQP